MSYTNTGLVAHAKMVLADKTKYMWGGKGSKNYSGTTDVNARGMYNNAKIKGKIDTLPEQPGLILYCKSRPHVGIYIGNGDVIESTFSSRGDGVVKSKISDFGWEYGLCKNNISLLQLEHFEKNKSLHTQISDIVEILNE